MVIVAIFGFAYGTTTGNQRALHVISTFAPVLRDIVATNISVAIRYRGLSGILGFLGLIWSGKNIFQALSYALNRSLDLKGRSVLLDTTIAAVLVPIVGIALLIVTSIPIALEYIAHFAGLDYLRFVPRYGSYAFAAFVVFIISALLYAFLPNRRASFRFGIPGALFTAVVWSFAQVAFGIYTAHTNVAHVYGAISALLVVLLWIYATAAIFLFGAHVSAAWERAAEPQHASATDGPPA